MADYSQCPLTSGVPLGCFEGLGSITEIYVSNYSDTAVFAVDADDQISGATGASGSTEFFTYQLRAEQGTFDETSEKAASGAQLWTASVGVTLYKADKDLRNQLILLGKTELMIIVKDAQGSYFLVGQDNGAELESATMGRGTSFTDLNGSVLTFTAKQATPARQMSAAAFAELVVSS